MKKYIDYILLFIAILGTPYTTWLASTSNFFKQYEYLAPGFVLIMNITFFIIFKTIEYSCLKNIKDLDNSVDFLRQKNELIEMKTDLVMQENENLHKEIIKLRSIFRTCKAK